VRAVVETAGIQDSSQVPGLDHPHTWLKATFGCSLRSEADVMAMRGLTDRAPRRAAAPKQQPAAPAEA